LVAVRCCCAGRPPGPLLRNGQIAELWRVREPIGQSVTRRHIKNNKLNAAGYTWAFSALTASPGARAYYDRRRDDGDRHAAAQRNLFGYLHRCLTPGQYYDENIAFLNTTEKLPAAA
jgi:hypothetical protein